MRRRIDHFPLEGEVAFVDVSEDRLVLLREQRHEVHLAVVIQIHRNDVNGARAAIDRMSGERRLRHVRRLILEDGDLSRLAMPERGDGEVVLAVAVEVGRLDVGDARPSVQPERVELAVAQTSKPDHRAFVVILRKERPEIGNEQILDAVLVKVGHGDVRRVRDARDDGQRAARLLRMTCEDESLPHVGAEHVELPVAVEIHQVDVGDCRRVWHVRHRQAVSCELDGRLAGVRPEVQRGKMLRRAADVKRERLLHVGRQLYRAVHRAGRTDGRQPVLTDEHHPDEFVAPGVARKDVRLRKDVADAARRASLLVIALALRCRRGLRRRPRCKDQRRRLRNERKKDDA